MSLKALHSLSVNILAHSKGAILPRWVVRVSHESRIDRAVTTPIDFARAPASTRRLWRDGDAGSAATGGGLPARRRRRRSPERDERRGGHCEGCFSALPLGYSALRN